MRSSVWLKPVADSILPPSVHDFWVGRINPVWSRTRVLARVVSRQTAARDAVTLELKVNRNHRGLVPGQHITVTVEIDGVRHARSYSPVLVAGDPRRLAITVKRVEGGLVSNWLCDQVAVGEVVELGEAFGDMTVAAAPAALLCLAAGSGITPFLSMIRAQALLGMPRDITLICWAGQRDELCAVDELQALAERFPRLRVQFVLTRADADRDHGERLQAAHLAAVPGLAETTIYACGPAGFVATAGELAAAVAVPFHGEAFSLPTAAVASGAPVRVTLARSRRELMVPAGQPLLAAIEAEGLKPASGCRMGICNTCACAKLEGSSEDVRTGERHHEAASALRICISSARSDLVLDL